MEGSILQKKFNRISEQIIRWHSLYGLHSRVDKEHIREITMLLEEQGTACSKKKEETNCTVGHSTKKI